MPLKQPLPRDLETRLAGLGEAIAAACPDLLFAYVFGRASTDRRAHAAPGHRDVHRRCGPHRRRPTAAGPGDRAESFEILAEADLLPRVLGHALASMVGFRNIPVHDYARVDHAIVVRVLRTDLADIERFRDALKAIV